MAHNLTSVLVFTERYVSLNGMTTVTRKVSKQTMPMMSLIYIIHWLMTKWKKIKIVLIIFMRQNHKNQQHDFFSFLFTAVSFPILDPTGFVVCRGSYSLTAIDLNTSSMPLFSLTLMSLKIAPLDFAYFSASATGTCWSSKSILLPIMTKIMLAGPFSLSSYIQVLRLSNVEISFTPYMRTATSAWW